MLLFFSNHLPALSTLIIPWRFFWFFLFNFYFLGFSSISIFEFASIQLHRKMWISPFPLLSRTFFGLLLAPEKQKDPWWCFMLSFALIIIESFCLGKKREKNQILAYKLVMPKNWEAYMVNLSSGRLSFRVLALALSQKNWQTGQSDHGISLGNPWLSRWMVLSRMRIGKHAWCFWHQ